jgi:hypothetical protein
MPSPKRQNKVRPNAPSGSSARARGTPSAKARAPKAPKFPFTPAGISSYVSPYDPDEIAERVKKIVFSQMPPSYQHDIDNDYRKINQDIPLFPDLGVDKYRVKLMIPSLDSIIRDYNPVGALLGPDDLAGVTTTRDITNVVKSSAQPKQ